MSLETSIQLLNENIAKLVASVQANTEALQSSTYVLQGPAVDDKPAAKKEEKPAAKKEEKPAAKKEEKPAAKKEDKPAVEHPTEDDLIAKAKEYLPADLDKEERARRHGIVKPKLDEMGAKKATDLKPEQRQDFIDFIDAQIAEISAGDDSGDEDDLV